MQIVSLFRRNRENELSFSVILKDTKRPQACLLLRDFCYSHSFAGWLFLMERGTKEMMIGGLQKLTLLDYPDKLAATVFTVGCDFRCPFCHNALLVSQTEQTDLIPADEVIAYLQKRRNVLDGVCITGGEPLLQKDLKDFIKQIKELGLLVKLDTNGYHPQLLIELIEEKLVDMVAMDIKNCLEKYPLTAGVLAETAPIKESAAYLMKNRTAYEFRTTVAAPLFDDTSFVKIGEWLAGSSSYYLQNYKASENMITGSCTAYSRQQMYHFLSIVNKKIPNAALRGVD